MEIDKIYLGDCLELMKEIPDKSIDCIICDLPYGTTACAWDSVIPLPVLWSEYKRVVKPWRNRSYLHATVYFSTRNVEY